jgi:outer membrane lipoprotein-sorting protein
MSKISNSQSRVTRNNVTRAVRLSVFRFLSDFGFRLSVFSTLSLLLLLPFLTHAEPAPPLERWLEAQSKLTTWSADFVQTRSLKALAHPLTSEGKLWYAAPDQFRWELGTPAQTIAVRRPDRMLLLYPRLKRAEIYPVSGQAQGQWREMLALLEAGFPRSSEELQKHFQIVSRSKTGDLHEITLQPRTADARRWMPQMKIVFSESDWLLRATELHFADGSILRNEFSNIRTNPELPANLFSPEIPDGFKVTEAGKRR